jgi:SpoVK/Ycf46/Vps4 family AAA+-type ATPase
MLQLLDGILSPDGIIFIFTTNDPNSLDPALYRDGRINLIVEMSYPMVTDVCDYLSDYFDIKMSTSEFISSVLGGKGFDDTVFPLTLATVENLCIFNDDVHEVLKQLKNML